MPDQKQTKVAISEADERFASERQAHSWLAALSRWLITTGVLLLVCLAGATGWFVWYTRIAPPAYFEHPSLPRIEFQAGRAVMLMPNGNLVGLVGSYPDELSAFLRFQYLQSLQALAGTAILMTVTETHSGPLYKLYLVLKNDLLSQTDRLADLQIGGYIHSFETDSPSSSKVQEWRKQTLLFETAYRRPVQMRLMQLPRAALTSAVAKFILFKTRTDRRMRERIEPALDNALTAEDARDFAADMIDVARFYDIPLDMLLGIGAMENNYLDIRGDLRHAVWKKRPRRDDIVLKRRKGRVLVSNYSLGPWQITRETLRYVHRLYLNDERDDHNLPARLRPPKKLDLDHVDSHVLTTYAGLLLRKLLDSFGGDVAKAQGAYNGGSGRPNLRYSEGVSIVAEYARRVISMAAGRKGNSVAETPLIVAKKEPS